MSKCGAKLALLVLVCGIATSLTAADPIEFGPREYWRCGDADRYAERVLAEVLGVPVVTEALAAVSFNAPRYVDYLAMATETCTALRRRADRADEDYARRRAREGAQGWPEDWVREYFQFQGGWVAVVLQSSASFRDQIDESQPLTTAWPGRWGTVAFYDDGLNPIGVFDSMGRSLPEHD